MKSFENKSNLHHCATELSDAFHLAPFKTFPPSLQPIISSKLTTPFHGFPMEKKKCLQRCREDQLLLLIHFDPSFFQIPCRFKPSLSLSSFCNHHTAARIAAKILSVLFPASFPPSISSFISILQGATYIPKKNHILMLHAATFLTRSGANHQVHSDRKKASFG